MSELEKKVMDMVMRYGVRPPKQRQEDIANDKLISSLLERIQTLEAKVKRLQQSKLDKFAMAAMSGFCSNPKITNNEDIYIDDLAQRSIQQAKSLLAALEKEGCDER